jgi:hypothetical protein
MAKKSRRSRAKIRGAGQTPQYTAVKQNQTNTQAASRGTGIQSTVAATTIKPNQYDYVTTDLIRIGIIGGSLILILMILTFFLH